MHSVAWWPTCVVLAVATVTDLRTRRIPNWLVVPFLVAGLVVPAWLYGWSGLWQSLEGFGLGALIYGFLHWMGGMGMGDVKLVAAIGAWIGPQQLTLSIVLTAMAGGIMALTWAICGGFLGEIGESTGELVRGWKHGVKPNPEFVLANPKKRKMPYAPAIAIGTLISFFAHAAAK
jgi:prepilin peptidase CpaA